jgi:GT2 family glycosyltransferase
VPTVKNPARLRRCLGSIVAHAGESELPFEIIIVLDGAQPDMVDYVGGLSGATVVAWTQLRGLPAGLNAACRHARSDRIVVLQDDARAQPGWLPALIETAERHPRAGLVGSLVLAVDGSVMSAGALLLGDGHTTYPWPEVPPSPASFSGVRAVDYAAGTSYVFKREAWLEVGGFDEGLYPAIFVDVDFCTSLWQKGWQVLLDPRSTAVHERHGSTALPMREFLYARNRERVLGRWHRLLRGRPTYPPTPEGRAEIERRLASWLERPPADLPSGDRPSHVEPQAETVYVSRERAFLRDYAAFLEQRLEDREAEIRDLRRAPSP